MDERGDRMHTHRPSASFQEPEQRLVYSLDRRGPNDPRLGSVHVVIFVLIAALAVAMLAVS
jgi:hypothetical protein